MKKLIDYGITLAIFLATLLIAFALSGVSAGQDKPPQAPPIYDDEPKKVEPAKKTETDAERRQRIENEYEEAQRALDFTPLKGAIDEGYDVPDPVKPAVRFASREALRTAAWKDKTIPFTPKLPKVENDFLVAIAKARKEKKPLARWIGKDSAASREGGLILEEIGDSMVHVYMLDDVVPENNKNLPAVVIRVADGSDRIVRMKNCSADTSAKLVNAAESEDKLPEPKLSPRNQATKAAPVQFVQAPKAAGACANGSCDAAATASAPRAVRAPAVARAPVRRGG